MSDAKLPFLVFAMSLLGSAGCQVKKMDRFHHSFMSPISQLHHQVGYKLKIPYKISIKSD